MRKSLYAAILLFSSCSPVFAADAGSCYAIQSADARIFCLAKARKDAGTCYSIQSADLRAQCLAEVRQ